ncbi:hypothetical protein [Mucilaginibacter sp.]|uniref:hypothetical protein n=1 Tax=Mucilaginibacter sp. TaxID=1882438 RepID=UPI003D10C8E3
MYGYVLLLNINPGRVLKVIAKQVEYRLSAPEYVRQYVLVYVLQYVLVYVLLYVLQYVLVYVRIRV